MRITKVKAKVDGKDETILIYRSNQGAKLIIEKSLKDRTNELLPEDKLPTEKLESFKQSVKNKTIAKAMSIPEDATKDERARLKKIHKYVELQVEKLINLPLPKERITLPNSATLEEIEQCLKPSFQDIFEYHNEKMQKVSFNLAKAILDEAKRGVAPDLQGYIEWKNHFIRRKSKTLNKSIKNNHLSTVLNLDIEKKSKRQQALKAWTDEYLTKNKCDINLADCEREYKIDELVAELNKVDIPTFEEDTNDKEKQKENATKRYEYCCCLKDKLNKHRKRIFGFGEDANVEYREDKQLIQYQEELKKYMERNFPLKASNRMLSPVMMQKFLRAQSIKDAIKNQLINSIRRNLIGDGRSQFFEYGSKTTSEDVQNTKIGENFSLKFLDACSFAANNICNVIGYKGDKDIINTSENEFAQNIMDTGRLKLFYPYAKQFDEALLWTMRSTVSCIRNQIVHFKENALDRVRNKLSALDNNTKFVEIFEAERDALPAAFAEKLKTAHILTYYPEQGLVKLFGEHKFHLAGSVVPFAPGYGNVYKQGAKYQDAQKKEGEYALRTKYYVSNQESHKENEKEELRLARYNLLKLVYNHFFLNWFTGDTSTSAFRKAVEEVINRNKQFAEGRKNKQQYAFHDIRKMNSDESITAYMRHVQSAWTQELAKKKNQKADQVAHKEASINCANFVLQVFIKGFDTYLQSNPDYELILHPECQIPPELMDGSKEQSDWLNAASKAIAPCFKDKITLSENQHKHIGFYVFCKLLDANHLSTLRNELIKYKQSPCADQLPCALMEMIDGWMEMLEMCLLSVDQVPNNYKHIEQDPNTFIKRITPYVEDGADLKQWGELFYQSDKVTPIILAPVEIALKYGTAKILQLLMERNPAFKVSKAEFVEWAKKKDEIAEWVKERDKLHVCWIKQKAKDAAEKKNKVPPKERTKCEERFFGACGERYKNLCDYIERYNWLDNQVHLQHLTRLHNLIIDLLGRMIGFTHFWERDYRMVYANLKEYRNIENHPELDFDGENGLPKFKDKDKDFRDLYFNIILNPSHQVANKKNENRETRNYVAHLNYLTTGAGRSLIDLVNDLRTLTEYDRKLKNAVCKSIIKIFDQYGMELRFTVNDNHRFEVESLDPKKILHLGGEIETNHVNKQFCDMCEALLTLKADNSHG